MKLRLLIPIITMLCSLSHSKLIPTPFITQPHNIQRLGWKECQEHLEKLLFTNIYGISGAHLRIEPTKLLLVMSDPALSRIIYGIKSSDGLLLKAYPNAKTGYAHFRHPKGLCIDTSLYLGNQNLTFVYVVDEGNNRIVRLKYDAAIETLAHYDYIGEGLFYKARGVSCAAIPSGGSYMVVADAGNNRIVIYKVNPDCSCELRMTYGTEGTGIGQFKFPQGISISQIPGQSDNYYIYVADKWNHRVVCLQYQGNINTILWQNTYQDPEGKALFCEVTSNSYYCVYATDKRNHKIWVFAPELNELLYTYGEEGFSEGQFELPCDICIIADELAITEEWTASTGIQYFKIIPEIREFYPEPNIFDATEDSVKINFRVDETAHYLTMEVAGRNLFENQYYVPGRYSVYWDGRDANGKVVLPGSYVIRIYCQGEVIATSNVTVKGT